MNLQTETFGKVVVVHTPEELGVPQADDFASFVRRLERKHVVFDLDGTELLDSAGLTSLLDAQDLLRSKGGDAKAASGNAINRKILEITRLDRQLEVFESVVDAVRSLQ
jgi:anti-anti-sigma factor